jgi:hypothetical protein
MEEGIRDGTTDAREMRGDTDGLTMHVASGLPRAVVVFNETILSKRQFH